MEEPRIPTKPIAGEYGVQMDQPAWEPLLYLVGEDLTGGFMWMGEIRLADGTALHAYKHRATRRYIHLTCDGRAFSLTEKGRYRQIEILAVLQAAMRAVFRTPTYYWDPEYRWAEDPDEPHPMPDTGKAAGLVRRAAEIGVSVPELLRAEAARLASQPSVAEWLDRTRRRTSPITRAQILADLDKHRGEWPDAGR